MKITLLSRIRNEELLLPDFLNHIDKFADEFFWYDDDSTDNSVKILQSHPKTKKVLRNEFWNQNQAYVQTAQRQLLLNYAKTHSKNKYFLYAEPDERIEFNFKKLDEYDKDGIDGILFKLLDGYLTEENKTPYKQGDKLEDLKRMWGIEMREIMFLFNKNKASYNLTVQGMRQPILPEASLVVTDGFVKHFSKCISAKKYEADCDYYSKSMPLLADKWKKRKGKAIKKDYKSDFGTKLYSWEQVKKHLVKI